MSTIETVRNSPIDDVYSRSSDRPSEEEIQVMQMVAGGLKDHAIARRLGVSIVTVRRRARRFRSRVGAANRSQAIAFAANRGWLTFPEEASEGAEPPTDQSD